MEIDLAKFDKSGGTIDEIRVKVERGPDGVPREAKVRWRQFKDGVTEIFERGYPNVPPLNFGPQAPYSN